MPLLHFNARQYEANRSRKNKQSAAPPIRANTLEHALHQAAYEQRQHRVEHGPYTAPTADQSLAESAGSPLGQIDEHTHLLSVDDLVDATSHTAVPLDRDTAQALVTDLDPFHDKGLPGPNVPAPRDNNAPSVVTYIITREMNLTAPPGLGPDQTWDANICFTPLMSGHKELLSADSLGSDYNNETVSVISLPDQPNYGVGTITAVTNFGGARTWFDASKGQTWDANAEIKNLSVNSMAPGVADPTRTDISDPLTDGPLYVDAAAFEVINATPVVDKGGSVVYYESPQGEMEPVLGRVWPNAHPTGAERGELHMFRLMRSPPGSVEEAAALPRSIPRAAWEGGYTPGVRSNAMTGFRNPKPVRPVFVPTEQHAAYGPSSQYDIETTSILVGGVSGIGNPNSEGTPPNERPPTLAPPFTHVSGFVSRGQYYTGLPGDTVLRVTARFKVVLATQPDSPYFPFAAMPPAFDPDYALYYNHIIAGSPCGWPVRYNGLGEAFRSFVRTASRVVLPVARIAVAGLEDGPVGAVTAAADETIGAIQAAERRKAKARKRKTKRLRAKLKAAEQPPATGRK